MSTVIYVHRGPGGEVLLPAECLEAAGLGDATMIRVEATPGELHITVREAPSRSKSVVSESTTTAPTNPPAPVPITTAEPISLQKPTLPRTYSGTRPSFLDIYQQEVGHLSGPQMGELASFLDMDMPEELIIHAIYLAASCKARSFAYIAKILYNWHKDGIRNMAQLEAHEQEFAARKRAAKENGKPRSAGKPPVTDRSQYRSNRLYEA